MDWKERDHPRDLNGKFAKKTGGKEVKAQHRNDEKEKEPEKIEVVEKNNFVGGKTDFTKGSNTKPGRDLKQRGKTPASKPDRNSSSIVSKTLSNFHRK